MSPPSLRWGILGTAQIARKNWHAIHNSGNGVVAAVASRDHARAEQFVAECQAQIPLPVRPAIYGSYEALLDAPDVEAVYVPLPTGRRKEWVLRAAAAGKHVLCEKPCAPTVADLLEMTEACRRQGRQFMDGVMFVHSRRFAQVRELITTGSELGELRRINSQFSFRGDEAFFASNMRIHRDLEPQGCLGDLGWYSLVLTLEAFAGRMPREVSGRILSTFGAAGNSAPLPAEFSGELVYEGGVTSSFYCSFLTENQQWASLSGSLGHLYLADFVLPFAGTETEFQWYRSEFQVNGCSFAMRPGVRSVRVPEHANNHPTSQEALMFRQFAQQVRSGVLNSAWPERALQTQQLLEACLQSAATSGRPVSLPEKLAQ